MEEDMLKKHIAACLVTTALLAAPALAQTSSGSSGSSGAASSSAASGKFMTEEKPNQWRASKLVGVNVYGPNNEKVGDVNEVLIDRNGKAEAVVIGVGGFLGIGEKDVALPFDQVQWSDQPPPSRSASGGSGSGGSGGGAAGTTGSTGTTTGSTGSTASSAGGTSASSGSASSSQNRGYPDHGMITMSKDELKNAPSFRYAGNTSRDNNAGGNRSGAGTGGAAGTGMGATGSGAGGAAGTGAGTAPRQ
jgi:sporulation protein YlmC with PRC-barrel domain